MTLRDTHVDTVAAIAEPVYYPLAMVQMDFASGAVFAHSGTGDILWNGYTFKGVSWLGKIEDWQEGEGLQNYGVRLELSGLQSELVALSLNEHYRGRALKVWIAFLNDQGQIEGEPMGPWRWRMSTIDGEFTGARGKLVLSAGSRMAFWERDDASRYTDEDHRSEHPDDFFFEFVSASAEREIEF